MKKYYSIYVRNQYEGASCYYRIIQYLNELDDNFVINNAMSRRNFRRNLDINNLKVKKILQVHYYILMVLRLTWFLIRDIYLEPHCVIVQRTTLPRYTPLYFNKLLELLAKKTTLYWDFDDDIFSNGEISESQATILCKFSSKIIVTSDYLKNRIPENYRDKVIILPTTDGDFRAIDKNAIYKQRENSFKSEIKLVWVATSSNIPHIEGIIPTLDLFAEYLFNTNGKQLVLSVLCNKPVTLDTKYLKIINIFWTREAAHKAIVSSHIGIMPLQYSEYALGKGGFKLIQYIATGLPVIASRVGFNDKVINESCGFLVDDISDNDEWKEALEKIIHSWEEWNLFSVAAYKQWTDKFSYESNLVIWKKLINHEM